jgi:hypothetical protein
MTSTFSCDPARVAEEFDGADNGACRISMSSSLP